MRKKPSFYAVVAAVFSFVRQFLIPNPFDALGEGLTITVSGLPVLLTPVILNLAAEPMIYAVTFGVVKLYYRGGSAPALGSALYMLFYWIHTGLLRYILAAYPSIWLIMLMVAVYVGIHGIAVTVKNKLCF